MEPEDYKLATVLILDKEKDLSILLVAPDNVSMEEAWRRLTIEELNKKLIQTVKVVRDNPRPETKKWISRKKQ